MSNYGNKHLISLTPWAAAKIAQEDYSRLIHVARALGIRMKLSARTASGPYDATIWASPRTHNVRLDSWGASPVEAAVRVLRSFVEGDDSTPTVDDPELALLIGAHHESTGEELAI